QKYGLAVVDQLSRSSADTTFFFGPLRHTLHNGRLRHRRVFGHCAAMRALDAAGLVELLQVAPDGRLANTEVGAQLGNSGALSLADETGNLLLAFSPQHLLTSCGRPAPRASILALLD